MTPPYAIFASSSRRATGLFVVIALLCLIISDIAVTTLNPWHEMGRLMWGIVTPDFLHLEQLSTALLRTLAFGFTGVAIGSVSGFMLALIFHLRFVRVFCAFIRSIHELFWALIFLQFFGLHPLTGVLAICIPFAGVFAKVYSEILEEADQTPHKLLPQGSGLISSFVFARIPDAWPHLVAYTSYRLECGLRSSAVLGFVGLPTIGFQLESAFSQGNYSEVGALLLLFYLLIATLKFWVRPKLIGIYVLAAPWFLGSGLPIIWGNVARFFTEDIIPAPLRDAGLSGAESFNQLLLWLQDIFIHEALPGIWNTLVLTQIALVATGIVTLITFPLISRHFGNPTKRFFGQIVLVVVRSTPEYILAYMLLTLWGPSMLPAIVALALHNGGVIAYLIGRQSNELKLRMDAPTGLNRYSFELLPRLYGPFLAFLFYRWEIIMRETAILGILGIHTLGFYVDNAIQDIRFDRAMILILITALLNILIDSISRKIRDRLRLKSASTCEA